jgi:SsrA-binding protein
MSDVLIQNRKAWHDYHILDRFEAGLVLTGSEVKSLRAHRASLAEAYIIESGGELYLQGAHINEYAPARHFGHTPLRPRKLLLRKKQINKILGQITKKGMTAVPLKIYSNEKRKLKLEMALALGMKKYDKRAALKEKEFQRTKQQVLKEKNR